MNTRVLGRVLLILVGISVIVGAISQFGQIVAEVVRSAAPDATPSRAGLGVLLSSAICLAMVAISLVIILRPGARFLANSNDVSGITHALLTAGLCWIGLQVATGASWLAYYATQQLTLETGSSPFSAMYVRNGWIGMGGGLFSLGFGIAVTWTAPYVARWQGKRLMQDSPPPEVTAMYAVLACGIAWTGLRKIAFAAESLFGSILQLIVPIGESAYPSLAAMREMRIRGDRVNSVTGAFHLGAGIALVWAAPYIARWASRRIRGFIACEGALPGAPGPQETTGH